MATVVRTIRASGNGGDYTSLSTWNATEQTDLVAEGDTHEAHCFGDDFGGPDGALLEGVLTIGGWTTDADHFVTIRVAPGQEHNGVRRRDGGTGFLVEISGGGGLSLATAYTVVQDIEIIGVPSTGASITFSSPSVECMVQRCLIQGGNTGSYRTINYTGSPNSCTVRNCVITSTGRVIDARNDAGIGVLQSNTISTTGQYGILADSLILTNNNVCVGATIGDFFGTHRTGSSNNASQDSTARGTNPVTGVNPATDFVDAANGDYRPAEGGLLDGSGADLSGTFTDDVTGATRTVPWDIGAYAIGGAPAADTIFFGDTPIQSMSFGDTPITEVYHGGNKIWPG